MKRNPRARAPHRLKTHGFILYTHTYLIDFQSISTPQCIESLSFFSVNDSSNLNQSLKKKRALARTSRSPRQSWSGPIGIVIMNTAAVCNATKIRATVVVGKASASSAKRVVPTQRAAQRVVKVRLRCVVRCVLRWNGSEGLIE